MSITKISQNTIDLHEILNMVHSLPDLSDNPETGGNSYNEGYDNGYIDGQISCVSRHGVKTITENGEYTPADDGFSAYSKVTVNVPVSESGGNGEIGKPYIDSSKMRNFNAFFYSDESMSAFGNDPSLLENLDTSNGVEFDSMFDSCEWLVESPPLNTSNGRHFDHMFNNCTNLVSVPLIDISNADSASSMFENCTSLETVRLIAPTGNTHELVGFYNIFVGCVSLRTLQINEGAVIPLELKDCVNLSQDSANAIIENLGSWSIPWDIGLNNIVFPEHIVLSREQIDSVNNNGWLLYLGDEQLL